MFSRKLISSSEFDDTTLISSEKKCLIDGRSIFLFLDLKVCKYTFTVYPMYSVNLQIFEFEPIIDKQHYAMAFCIIIMVYRLSIVLRAVF